MSLPENCQHQACGKPRARLSVLCEEHHRAQLIRVGLERETPPDPCARMPDTCRRIVRAQEVGAITGKETSTSLFDQFIHWGKQRLERCWGPCLDALPPDAVADLLAYAKEHPEPRLFHPLPEPGAVRQEAERLVLAVQGRLVRRLEEWLPPGERQGAAGADWYRVKRREVEAFFTEDHLVVGSEQVHDAPSGKYRLVATSYKTNDGCWNYTRGRAYAGERLIADVKRNFSGFSFGWAEEHPDGHDYLLCGEDYQGQTVVQLDTGRRADYVPEAARGGGGFCCAAYYPSPDRALVVIDGCVWAAPYELVFCQFGDPMSLPWPQIDRADLSGDAHGWTVGGFVYETSEDVRVTDGTACDVLLDVEQDDLWARWDQIGGQRVRRWLRASDGSKALLDERVVPASEKTGG